MKKYLMSLAAITIIVISANAQVKRNTPGDKSQDHKKMGQRKHSHHNKGMMMKELNFSDAQKQQAKLIRSDYSKQLEELEQDKNITLQDYRTKKAALQKQQKSKFESLLTTDQKNQLAQNKQEKVAAREKMEQKRLDRMKSQLNLTDAQVSKLQSQREVFKAQAGAIRDNTSLSSEQKKQQLMELRKSSKESEKNIFTTEQLQKRDNMRSDEMRRENLNKILEDRMIEKENKKTDK